MNLKQPIQTNQLSRKIWRKVWFLFLLIIIASCKPETASPEPTETAIAATEGSIVVDSPALDFPIIPRVIASTPSDHSSAALNERFTFYFNVPMDQPSVEGAFSIQPEAPGSITWIDDQTMLFQPEANLPLETHYTLSISTEAYSQNGESLQKPFDLNVTTCSPLLAAQHFPADQSIDVDTNSAVWVAFNQNIVNLETEEQIEEVLTISPEIPGIGRWANQSTYIYYPSATLLPSTTYTVQINPELAALSGASFIESPASFEFSTTAPKLVSITPTGDTLISADSSFTLTFNHPMSQESVESNLLIQTDNEDPIPLNFEWTDQDRVVTITPVELLPRGASVALSLNQSASEKNGITLMTDTRTEYQVTPLLAIDTLPASEIEVEYNGYAQIQFQTNLPLASDQDFLSYINFAPANIQYLQASLSDDARTLTYSGLFQPSTVYTYTLSASLRDQWGDTLDESYYKHFVTQSPSATLKAEALDNDFPILYVPSTDSSVPISTTNVRRIDLESALITVEEFAMLADADQSTRNAYQPVFDRTWYQIISPYIKNAALPAELSLTQPGKQLNPGLYYYAISSPELNENSGDPKAARVALAIVSQIQITVKRSQNELLIWAVDLDSLDTIANKNVTVYDTNGSLLDAGTTDAKGLYSFEIPENNRANDRFYIMVAEPGDDAFGFAMTSPTTSTPSYHSLGYNQPPLVKVLTDKPIYLPGETLKFEILVEDQATTFPVPDLINVQLVYQLNDTELPVEELFLELSEFSTAGGSFTLPEGITTGQYKIVIPELESFTTVPITEEFISPAHFAVSFAANPVYGSQEVQAEILLEYAFGAPYQNQSVQWQLFAEPTKNASSEIVVQSQSSDQALKVLKEGVCTTDSDGKCLLSFDDLVEMDVIDQHGHYQLILVAETQLEAASQILRVVGASDYLPDDYTIQITPESWEAQAGTELGFGILTQTRAGESISDISLNASFQRVYQTSQSTFTDGELIDTSVVNYEQAGSTTFFTDQNGYARLVFTPSDPGIYRLLVEGDFPSSTHWLWVGGEGDADWIFDASNLLLLDSDKDTYQVGDSAQIFLPNPFDGDAIVLLTIENDTVKREQILTIKGSSEILTLPLTKDDSEGLVVAVTMIGQIDGLPASIQANLPIHIENNSSVLFTIEPTIKTEEDKARLKINTQIGADEPIPAYSQLTMAVIPTIWLEQSTLTTWLAPFAAEPISHTITTYSPFNQYSRQHATSNQTIQPDNNTFFLPTLPRLTKEQAVWIREFETDEEGLVIVEFPVDLQYDEYTVFLVATTEEGLQGSTNYTLQTHPVTQITMRTPQSAQLGDHFPIEAALDSTQFGAASITVGISGSGFTLDENEDSTRVIEISSGSSLESQTWWITITDPKSIHVIVTATNNENETLAVVEKIISVQAMSVVISEAGRLETPAEQWLQIQQSPFYEPIFSSRAITVANNLPGLLNAPIRALFSGMDSTTESMASAMMAASTVIQTADNRKIPVPQELQPYIDETSGFLIPSLLERQNTDGGWSNWAAAPSDPTITTYIVYAELEAMDAGFEIPQDSIDQAITYLQNQEIDNSDLSAFREYLLAKAGKEPVAIEPLSEELENLSPLGKALLLLAYIHREPGASQIETLNNELLQISNASEQGTYWSAAEGKTLFSSLIFTNAIIMQAFASTDPTEPQINNASNFVVLQNNANLPSSVGQWQNSFDAAWAMKAISVAAALDGYNEIEYQYSIYLNQTALAQNEPAAADFSTSTISITQPLNQNEINMIQVVHQEGSGSLYFNAIQQDYLHVDAIQPAGNQMSLTREYHLSGLDCRPGHCTPEQVFNLADSALPIQIRLNITIESPMQDVLIKDYMPTGAEFISLADAQPLMNVSADNPLASGINENDFILIETGNGAVSWYAESVEAGTYVLCYFIMPTLPGDFHVPPALAYAKYSPLQFALSQGNVITFEED